MKILRKNKGELDSMSESEIKEYRSEFIQKMGYPFEEDDTLYLSELEFYGNVRFKFNIINTYDRWIKKYETDKTDIAINFLVPIIKKIGKENMYNMSMTTDLKKIGDFKFIFGIEINFPDQTLETQSLYINENMNKESKKLDELSEQEIIQKAESMGWRMIHTDDYGFDGHSIQKKKSFLGFVYWVDEYLCKDRKSAIESLKKRI